MIEILKFFFDDIWHFLGLVVVICIFTRTTLINIGGKTTKSNVGRSDDKT